MLSGLNQLRATLKLHPLADQADLVKLARHIHHLQATDPEGFWVSENNGAITGFTQAARRGPLWVLAHLFVDPFSQSTGIGVALLDRAIRFGDGCASGIIASSPDPRAIRSYAKLPGFELHPRLAAVGTVRDRPLWGPDLNVRSGSHQDLSLAADIDLRLRAAPHDSDLTCLLGDGAEMRVVPERGYAVVAPGEILLLAALDVESASALLLSVVQEHAGRNLRLPHLTEAHQWAMRIAVDAGLTLRPWGPLLTRRLHPSATYLPHTAFC